MLAGAPGLVGREEEIARIARALSEPARLPATILVEGEAGAGKTTVWRAAVDEARGRGYRVLACAGAAAESQLSMSAFRDLLRDAYADVAAELPAPQRRAMAVALLHEEPGAAPPDQGAIAAAFLATFLALARRSPLLIAVDDVQWLDPMSATLLAYARRRFDHEPIAVLLSRRLDADRPASLEPEPDDERVDVIRLGELSVGALGSILRDRLDVAYPRPMLVRLHEASGGNPLFALELARALQRAPRSVRPGAPLPVPDTLGGLIRARLRTLPRETMNVLLMASTLARPYLAVIGRAIEADPLDLLEPAIEAQVADIAGDELRFGHPLIAAAVYDLASVPRRRETHRLLAGVVDDLEERALHLALGTDQPDEEVARIVEDGARLAFARGSPAAAADLAAHARRLSPLDAPQDLRRRSGAEAEYHFEAGDTDRAAALLDTVIAETAPGPARARLLSRRARFSQFGSDMAESVRLLEQALAEVGDDGGLRAEVEEGLAWGLLLVRRDLKAAARHARSSVRQAEALGDRAAISEGLAAVALTAFMLGRPWRATMRRAVSLEDAMLDRRVLRHPSFAWSYCLSCADDHDASRALFDELLARARAQGDESAVPSILNRLALVEWSAGRWDLAARHADEGFARAVESGQRPIQASNLGKSALVAACRGRFAEALEAGSRAVEIAQGPGFDPARPERACAGGAEWAIWALGFAALADERHDEAHRVLGPLTDALLAAGIQEPGEVRWLADDVEALVRLGRTEEAEGRVALLETWGRRLDRRPTLAAAARSRGLLAAARDDPAAALEAYREAVRWLDGLSLPFELARALLGLGTQQRRVRQRKAARETLEQARAIFEDLGAEPWVARAARELGRVAGRAPGGPGLTPTERQVAALVAAGRTNREVADVLVVSVHTVEAALTHVYGKLGIRSRSELARQFATLDEPKM